MDHPTHLARELPWRTTALVAAAVAAIELLLLVTVATVSVAKPLLERDGRATRRAAKDSPAAAAARNAVAPAPVAARLARSQTSVIVLNGNGASGAASEKADWIRTKGYAIAGTANAPRTDFARSVVMYRPGFEGEAQRLAKDFGVARVSPLDGLAPADLGGAKIAFVVGAS